MMNRSGGYSSYHGRTPKGKIILAVLLVLIIVAAGVFIWLQDHLVYDDSGKPHLRLPESELEEPLPPADVDLTIQSAEPEGPEELRAFAVPSGVLTAEGWETAWKDAALASAPAYNAAVVTLKDDSGRVYFDAAAAVSGAAATAADTGAVLAEITGENSSFYTVARLSCFHDPKAANADVEGMGLKNTGGYIFYDGSNSQWLDPSKPVAREYLCRLAVEAAELGFDEILLTDVSYPTKGKLDKIDYGDADRAEALRTFLEEMGAALEPYGAALSVELPAEVLTTGQDAEAGQVLSEIAPLVDRIYAETSPEQIETLSAAVTASHENTDFVPELAGYTPDVAESCVIF
jgi:hypothetical protein